MIKINNNAFFLLIFLLFFAACDCPDKIPITKERMANKVLYQAAENLKREKALYASGSGGCMMNEIKTLTLSFSYYKPLIIEEGREVVIYAAQRLVDEINAEPQIRPYLYKYPFHPTYTKILIFVKNLDNSPSYEGDVSIITLIDGIIKYKIDDPETDKLLTIYQETYAEGLEKLNHSLQSQKL